MDADKSMSDGDDDLLEKRGRSIYASGHAMNFFDFFFTLKRIKNWDHFAEWLKERESIDVSEINEFMKVTDKHGLLNKKKSRKSKP